MFLDLRACIYKKNKLNWIKEQRHALHLDTLFLTKKKNLYIKILSHLGQRTFGYAVTKPQIEKKRKTFFEVDFFAILRIFC